MLRLTSWRQIIAGTLICSLAYNMFLIPNDIVPGGFTGIAQLLSHAVGWKVGSIALFLNIPMFLLSARAFGTVFIVRSLSATLLLSLSLDLLPIPSLIPADMPEKMMLSCVFGGILSGIGFGLILRSGAATGGTDMLAKLIKMRFPSVTLGNILFTVDALVILASAFVFDVVNALFALISVFLMSHIIDTLLDGFNRAHAYFIISDRHEEIASRIMMELKRGATGLKGHGMYSRTNRDVLLCVVSRLEAAQLRTIVFQTDSNAFMIAANVHEVLGEGFMPHQ